MSARFADAFLGYEYFLEHRGNVSIREINAHLDRLNRAKIAPRTYTHYKNLMKHGFMTYIPINKFDVFRALGKLQMAADRRRYSRRSVEIPVKLSRDLLKTTNCTIIDISLVGFGVVTTGRFSISPGRQVWIEMKGYDPIPCIVAWRKHHKDSTRLGLRATEFIENYRYVPEDTVYDRPLGVLIIQHAGPDYSDIDWNYFVHILDVSTELIQATSDLLVTVGQEIDRDIYFQRPLLHSIEFHSPGSALSKIDSGLAGIIQTTLEYFETIGLHRRNYRAETEGIELENKLTKERIENQRLENVNKKVEILRNAVNLKGEAEAAGVYSDALSEIIIKPIKEALEVDTLPEHIFSKDSLEQGILEERILPAAAELINGDDPDYRVAAKRELPDINQQEPDEQIVDEDISDTN